MDGLRSLLAKTDCVLASIPRREIKSTGEGGALRHRETDRQTGEKGLRGFWPLTPVGGKKKLTRKESSTFQFLEEVKL